MAESSFPAEVIREFDHWMLISRQDLEAARFIHLSSDEFHRAACSWAQQSGEKALKAAMCLLGVEFRRTHDLEALAGQLADAGSVPVIAVEDLRRLTPYAVEFRYDDEAIALLDPKSARRIVAEVLAWATSQLESRK